LRATSGTPVGRAFFLRGPEWFRESIAQALEELLKRIRGRGGGRGRGTEAQERNREQNLDGLSHVGAESRPETLLFNHSRSLVI
jgi:hypothetical protein